MQIITTRVRCLHVLESMPATISLRIRAFIWPVRACHVMLWSCSTETPLFEILCCYNTLSYMFQSHPLVHAAIFNMYSYHTPILVQDDSHAVNFCPRLLLRFRQSLPFPQQQPTHREARGRSPRKARAEEQKILLLLFSLS